MARITHVKAAQQRYETVPVLDDEGKPKQTPVMRKDGTQRTTKNGKLVFRTNTVEDRNQPLPLRVCGSCRQPIELGTPYKHITPKSGPYGGAQLNRHESCPTWQVWEYSSSMSARLAEIENSFQQALDSCESEDDVQQALDEAADRIEELADEKDEAGQNIEDGFQHETGQSAELKDTAEQLRSWAEEVRAATVPDFPEPVDHQVLGRPLRGGGGPPGSRSPTKIWSSWPREIGALARNR